MVYKKYLNIGKKPQLYEGWNARATFGILNMVCTEFQGIGGEFNYLSSELDREGYPKEPKASTLGKFVWIIVKAL